MLQVVDTYQTYGQTEAKLVITIINYRELVPNQMVLKRPGRVNTWSKSYGDRIKKLKENAGT